MIFSVKPKKQLRLHVGLMLDLSENLTLILLATGLNALGQTE
jgi:hypothetical protein